MGRQPPSTYQPTDRNYKMMEQTENPGGYRSSSKGVAIVDKPEYSKIYNRAASIFDAEAHHVIDLAWIDKSLHRAGLTSGAHGSANFSPERQDVIRMLNEAGVITGNDAENILPLSQHKGKGYRRSTGKAHTWVHDLYNKIPEASNSDLQKMSTRELADYLIDNSRLRKQIVIDALSHKLDALYELKPEFRSASPQAIRNWIRHPRNRATFGELGDKNFFQKVAIREQSPQVPGQPRGRVGIPEKVESVFTPFRRGYFGVEPVTTAGTVGLKLIRDNPLGAVAGAGSFIEPEAVKSALQGDYKEAATQTATGALIGAGTQQLAKMAVQLVPKAGSVVLAPVMAAAAPVTAAVGAVQMLDAVVEGATGKNLQETGIAAEQTKQRLKTNGYNSHQLRKYYRNGNGRPVKAS